MRSPLLPVLGVVCLCMISAAVYDLASSCVLQMLSRLSSPPAPAPSNIITIAATAHHTLKPPQPQLPTSPRFYSNPSANTLPHDTAALLCEEVVIAAAGSGSGPDIITDDGTYTSALTTSRWRCKVCGKETDYKSNTLRHIRVAHTANTYRCACGVEFKWSDSLKKHKRKCPAAAAASTHQAQVQAQQTSASIMASVVTAAAAASEEGDSGVEQLYKSMTS